MWRADDHEKLNRKQKLHRFKQVKWLKKKSGKKYRELLTADISFIFTSSRVFLRIPLSTFFSNIKIFHISLLFAKSEKKREF